MKRWVVVGGAVMMAAWVPFLYAEWTSRPVTSPPRSIVEEPSDVGVVTAGAVAPTPKTTEPAPGAPHVEPAPHTEPHAEAVSAAPHAPDAGVHGAPTGPDHLEAPVEPPTPSGPLDALKHAYETQPRDPLWASDTEAHIKGYFGASELPPELLHSASCRRAVCRLQVRWSSDHASSFVALNSRIAQDFAPEVALAPMPTTGGDDARQVDLYLMRKGFTVADLAK